MGWIKGLEIDRLERIQRGEEDDYEEADYQSNESLQRIYPRISRHQTRFTMDDGRSIKDGEKSLLPIRGSR